MRPYPEKHKPFQVEKSNDPEFNLENCFKNKTTQSTFQTENIDSSYFGCYSHFAIHEEMLKDKVRTGSYQDSIMKNKSAFTNKIVLDIGSGTGILSMFAAKAGAKHVYGIENAAIALHSKNIIKENGLEDKITIIQGKVEEIELPVEKVDIIISEWMGYFLLYESMFDTVLFAREKWLKKNGMLFPNKATLYIASIEDEEYKKQKFLFWDYVYGVNMKSIQKWALMEPIVDVVDEAAINSKSCPIFHVDLEKVTKEELNFASAFELEVTRKDYVHALVAWFDVEFTHSQQNQITLSTSPFTPRTHWKQTTFYIKDEIPVNIGDKIKGSIAVKKNEQYQRQLDIKISVHLENKVTKYDQTHFYRLT